MLVLASVCLLTWPVAGHVQTSFAGAWRSDGTRTAGPAVDGSAVSARGNLLDASPATAFRNVEERVTQSVQTLTIERRSSGGRQKFVYRLDGAESVNVNGASKRTTRSRWNGDTLVTEGTEALSSTRGALSNAFREARSIGNDGAMVVETTREFEGGGRTVSVLAFVKKK